MCGHVVFMCDAAISWSSRGLKLVPLSTCEAETACGALACRDLRYVQLVLGELTRDSRGVFPLAPTPDTPVLTDAQSCRDVVENPGVTARTRHYERWLHYMRELHTLLHIRLQLVRTTDMVANMFTKAVGRGELTASRGWSFVSSKWDE